MQRQRVQRIVKEIEEVGDGSGTLFNMTNHNTDLKIDAMFFSCTQDKLAVLGEEFKVPGGKEYVVDEAGL